MKQFLIHLQWYEQDKIAIIKAKNKIKALEKLVKAQIEFNKQNNEYDLLDGLPYGFYEDELTERQNIARYLKQILDKEVSCLCFEINQETDAIIQWQPKTNYTLEQIGN